jgi:hypothetical protein
MYKYLGTGQIMEFKLVQILVNDQVCEPNDLCFSCDLTKYWLDFDHRSSF